MTSLLPVCVQLIDFIEALKWGQEWVSSCPAAGSRRPAACQPLQWLIKTQAQSHKRRGIPFRQLGLPRDSPISFCLILHIQKTQQEHLPARAVRQEPRVHSSKGVVCYLSLSASFSLFPCFCEHCVPDSCATCSLWRMTKSKTPAV